jgi:hypothetical protein
MNSMLMGACGQQPKRNVQRLTDRPLDAEFSFDVFLKYIDGYLLCALAQLT